MPRRLTKNQKGFTLVELLVVLPIMAMIVGAASAVIIQLVTAGSTSAHMIALRQVQQAGYWVSTDALQAQNITGNLTTSSSLNLTWTDWDSYNHNITYSLVPMGDLYGLQRSDGSINMTVGQYLTNSTSCSWNMTAQLLTLNVTASVAGARGPQTETRTYEIKPRALA